MWTWLAIVITVATSTLGDSTLIRVFGSLQQLLSWLLVLSIAATVSGSFRRERETGVLELLLISPLSAQRIITGRLLGLWGQFLPAVILFVFVWGYISQLVREYEVFSSIIQFLVMFAVIPVVGLYFSLRCRSFIGAFLMTLLAGVALPLVLAKLIRFFLMLMFWSDFPILDDDELGATWFASQVLSAVVPLALAVVTWWFTNLRLERRRFQFERMTV
jgi:ABC-type transport system involved in multi-copper enzyme maturation permease subunit